MGRTHRTVALDRRVPSPGRRADAAVRYRTIAGGGLALLIRHTGGLVAFQALPEGQHRIPRTGSRRRRPVPPQRRAPREPQRTMQLLLTGLGTLIMAGICGLIAFFIVADERHGDAVRTSRSAVPAAATFRDISSRTVDSTPLSVTEVFPEPEIRIVPGAAAYRVSMTHIDNDCHVATTGELAGLLAESGCSQVVRATMTAPGSGYLVTAGMFNLTDEDRARALVDRVKPLIDTGAGSFAPVADRPGAEPSSPASAQVGWHTRGHFLIYCVITRPDGHIIADSDPSTERIVNDLVESYLREGVLARRASSVPVPTSNAPSNSSAPTAIPAQPLAPTAPLSPIAPITVQPA